MTSEARLAEARQMLREADTDNNGKISREEFYSLLANPLHHDSLDDYPARWEPKHQKDLSDTPRAPAKWTL